MVNSNTIVSPIKGRAGFEGLFIVENKKIKTNTNEPQFTKKKKNRKERTRRATRNYVQPESVPEYKDVQVRRTVVGHTLCKFTVRTTPRKADVKPALNPTAVEFVPGAAIHKPITVKYSMEDMLALRYSPKAQEMTPAVRETVAKYVTPKILSAPPKPVSYSMDAMRAMKMSPLVKAQNSSTRRFISLAAGQSMLAPMLDSVKEEDVPVVETIPSLEYFKKSVSNGSYCTKQMRPDYYRALCTMRRCGPSRLVHHPMHKRVADSECLEVKFGLYAAGQPLLSYPGTPAERIVHA